MFTSYQDYRFCHASPVRDARLPSVSKHKHPGPQPSFGLCFSLRSIRAAHNGSALLGTSGKVSQVRSFLRPVDRLAPGWGRRILYGNVPACTRRAGAFRQNRWAELTKRNVSVGTHIMRPPTGSGGRYPPLHNVLPRPCHFPEDSGVRTGRGLGNARLRGE